MATSAYVNFDKLTDSNYQRWKTLMKSLLQANDLWTCVVDQSDEDPDWTAKDSRALSLIYTCISESQLPHVAQAENSRTAWIKLRSLYEPPVSKATLYRQLTNMRKSSEETMTDYLNEFSEHCDRILMAGIQIPEELLCIILLNSLPREYENVIQEDEIPAMKTLKRKLQEEDIKNQNRQDKKEDKTKAVVLYNSWGFLKDEYQEKALVPYSWENSWNKFPKREQTTAEIWENEEFLMPDNVLSVPSLTERGNVVIFDEYYAGFLGKDGSRVLTAERKEDVYFMEKGAETCSRWSATENCRNFKNEHNLFECLICNISKVHESQYRSSRGWEKEILELVHSDVCGPFGMTSLGGARYFATFIDDHSRYSYVYMLKTPFEIFHAFRRYKTEVEGQTGKYIQCLRTDNMYMSETFKSYLEREGIQRELVPGQNGVAEVLNRTLIEMARGILVNRKLEGSLWAELINAANFVRNRCPSKILNNITPFEVWFGWKPYVGFFRILGSRVIAWEEFPQNGVHTERRGDVYILVGYGDLMYRLWKPGTREVINRRNVHFLGW